MATRPLRIAIFTETFLPKLDGVVTMVCKLLDHLRRIDADAIVFASGNRVDSYAGYPVISIPGPPVPQYPEINIPIPRKYVYDILRAFDPDLVHVVNPVLIGVVGIHFAHKLKKPAVASFHTNLMEMMTFYRAGIFEKVLWQYHKSVYNRADYTLAASKHTLNNLRRHGFDDLGLWQHGVDFENYSPAFASESTRQWLSDNHPEKTLLLSVGRLSPEKQIDQIHHVLDSIPGLHLAIVGDGPDRKRLEKIYTGYPVTFTGYLSGHKLSAAFASADIFVFPSSSFETFGLVVIEAMASGLAVVASRVGGVPELIIDGANGYVFDENDIGRMIARVSDMVEHPEKRVQFGQRARRSVYHLSWMSVMNDLIETYYEVLARYHTTEKAA